MPSSRLLIALVLAGIALACTASKDPSASNGDAGEGGGGGDGGAGGNGGLELEYLTELRTLEDYSSLSGQGAEVKYLATVEGREAPQMFGTSACAFQNTDKYPYHLQFLRTLPEYTGLSAERYADFVLRRESRTMWGGGLKLFPATPHPRTGDDGVLAYTVYSQSSASELLTAADITEVDRKLKGCSPFAAEWLVFTPDGAAQIQAVPAMIDALNAAGVSVVEPDALRPGLAAETYSEGEAYGYLTVATDAASGAGVGPRDVLVIDAAPNDLGLVAGLVSAKPQSIASHLNLRLREKGIPNASVPSVLENALISALSDRLVHLSARGSSVEIEPARLEDAEAFWRTHRPRVGEPRADLDVSELSLLSMLGAADAIAFGTKAANLGELSRLLPVENSVQGFAIPFRAYAEFMRANALDAEVESVLADPALRTNAGHKRLLLSTLRARIRGAVLPEATAAALDRAIRDAYGEAGLATRLRFRSSTNVEDLPGISGAGLYDSRSGCLADDLDGDTRGPSVCLTEEHEAYLRSELARRNQELADHPERAFLLDIIDDLEQDLNEEKSAYLALRRVWASLWNDRAFDDREHYGIDHRKVFMGVAVHPTFVGERLESVVLTNLEPDAAEPLYRVVSQVGEIGVVQPQDPTSVPEILTFRRSVESLPTSVTLVQSASLVEDGVRLWPDPALGELAELLFIVQDHFASNVYPDHDPLLLDVEVDVTMDGRTVLKQARPYAP